VSTLAQKNERSIVKLKLLLASDHTAIGIPRRFRMRPIHHVASSKCLICDYDEKGECAETIDTNEVAPPSVEPSQEQVGTRSEK
jgi:hypothetical protein